MDRRRALMMAKKSSDDNLIDGGNYSWVVGQITADGSLNTSRNTFISSDFISVYGDVLTYTGPNQGGGANYLLTAIQYDENKTPLNISASVLAVSNTSGNNNIRNACQLQDTCKYVRLVFGHAVSSKVYPSISEGSLVKCIVQNRSEVKNSFFNGTYANGTTSMVVENNLINVISATINKKASLYYKYPLNISNGDSVRIVGYKNSGSMSATTKVNLALFTTDIATNLTWGTGDIAFDVTKTITTDFTDALYVGITASGTQSAFTDYVLELKLYVNGIQVLPE